MAQGDILKKVQDVERDYRIKNWKSEPYHQYKNYAGKYQLIKFYVNIIMNRLGVKPCKRIPPDKTEGELEVNAVWWELHKMILVRAIGEC